MGPHTFPSVLYLDGSALDSQLVAVEKLYQSFLPVRPVVFSAVKRLPVSLVYSRSGNAYAAQIPGLLEMKVRRRLDRSGKALMPLAAVDYFSNVIEYADNLVYRVNDPEMGLKWDYSGRQSNYRQFNLHCHDYRDGKMLVQYADGSGSLTGMQRELIQSLNLPSVRHPHKSVKRR
jgi:hypothetical protein